MCIDCLDENDLTLSQGPTGPTGPTGPIGPIGLTPVLVGSSVTALDTAVGSKAITTQANLGFGIGQLVRVANPALTKIMVGNVTAYTGTTLTVNVTEVTGSGVASDWTIGLTGQTGARGTTGDTGATGATGATGQGAFTTLSADATFLGGSSYTAPVVNNEWISINQIIYVKDAGYYQVTAKAGLTSMTILNLAYAGNNTANLLSGKSITSAGIQGATGAAGSNGTNGTNGTNGVDGFIYETTDGNTTPAEATGGYQFLMRNAGNTGYTFINGPSLKAYLATLP